MRFKCVAVLTAAITMESAFASGLRTHIWIADAVLQDAVPDCKVRISRIDTKLPDEICESLRSDPEAFRAGMMGPDVFPDLITGQVTTHPGIEGDWQTSDWIKALLSRATKGSELSFAVGYASHAAVDMFAHTYVNAYAGDVFSLKDERRVELRHFVLEKYIDYHLPDLVNVAQVYPPVEYVTNQLLYSRDVERLSRKSHVALHISAMNRVRDSVRELDERVRDLDALAFGVVGDIASQWLKLQEELLTGEAQLKAAEEVLELNETGLKEQERFLNKIYEETQRAIIKAEEAESEWNLAIRLEDDIDRAIRDLEKWYKDANRQLNKLENDAINLAARIDTTPDTITEKICSEAKNWLGDIVDLFCKLVTKANPLKKQLRDEAADIAKKASNLKAELGNYQAKKASLAARKANAVNARIQKEKIAAQYRAFRVTAEAQYELEKQKYEHERKATEKTRRVVVDLREQIERTKRAIVDTEEIRDQVDKLISNLKSVSLYTTNWVDGIEVAGKEYIKTSVVIGRKVTEASDGAFSELLRWLNLTLPLRVSQFQVRTLADCC